MVELLDTKEDECHRCGFETTLKAYRNYRYPDNAPDSEKFDWLCDLCSGCIAPDESTTRNLCYIGNVILAEIKKLRS